MNLRALRFSQHALLAMARRDVTPEQVGRILTDPAGREPHQGRTRYVGRDGLAVVVSDGEQPVVVTVLLRSGDQWTDRDARRRSA